MLPITEELPDSWIDDYWDGIKKPSSRNRSAGEKTSVKAELEVYSGAALDWFSLFDLFKVLVDNSNNTPGEKLAILKQNLKGNLTGRARRRRSSIQRSPRPPERKLWTP